MRRHYQITTNRETGCPVAHIDSHEMWDLVEYMSNQRIAVSYTYCEGSFIVQFLHIDGAAAQSLMDEWANADVIEHVPSEALLVHL